MARPARCLRCDDILDELTPDGSRVCWVCVIEWQAAEARFHYPAKNGVPAHDEFECD